MVVRFWILQGIHGVEYDLLRHQLFVVFIISDDMNDCVMPPSVSFIGDVLGNLLLLVRLAADFCSYLMEPMEPRIR